MTPIRDKVHGLDDDYIESMSVPHLQLAFAAGNAMDYHTVTGTFAIACYDAAEDYDPEADGSGSEGSHKLVHSPGST